MWRVKKMKEQLKKNVVVIAGVFAETPFEPGTFRSSV